MSEETRRRLLAVARRVRAQGPLHPLIVVEGAGDEPALFFDANPFWGEQRQRRQTMFSLGGTLGYGVNAQRIYVVVEMWIAEEHLDGVRTPEEIEAFKARIRANEFVAPRDRPDRQDAVAVMELTRTETPAGYLLQTFTRHKGKLKWAEPRVWPTGQHVEDFTFGAFWAGVARTEALRVGVGAIATDIGMNSDQADETFRRASRRAALHKFGAAVFEEHEIGRVLRKWRQR